MPKNWKTYKLPELGTVARGKSKHRPRDAAHLYNGLYPFIQTGDVKAANHRLTKFTQSYSEAGLAQSKLWPKNTMCITIAANIAETAIIDFEACFPDSIIGFIPNHELCDIEFVEYMMQHFKQEVQTHAIGSVQDNINLATFDRVEFLLPPLPEQRAIASNLSALDDKIELNLQMNKTLEEMAMTLYKHWFVDFEFPSEALAKDGVAQPYKTAGGKFVESELGMIPEGWEVKELKKMVRIERQSYKPFNYPEESFFHYSIPSFDSKKYPSVEFGNEIKSGKTLISTNVILVSKLNPRFPRIWTVYRKDSMEVSFSSPEFINYVPLNDFDWAYINCLFRAQNFYSQFERNATGSTVSHQRVQPKITLEFIAPNPPDDIRKKFGRIGAEYFHRIESNLEEIQILIKTRDTLLPKLISGEVRVKDAEVQLKNML